jgi:hypothetical protein
LVRRMWQSFCYVRSTVHSFSTKIGRRNVGVPFGYKTDILAFSAWLLQHRALSLLEVHHCIHQLAILDELFILHLNKKTSVKSSSFTKGKKNKKGNKCFLYLKKAKGKLNVQNKQKRIYIWNEKKRKIMPKKRIYKKESAGGCGKLLKLHETETKRGNKTQKYEIRLRKALYCTAK